MINSPEELMEALKKLPRIIEVEAPGGVWMAVVAASQLALRHPKMPPPAAQLIRTWIENFADNMPPDLADHIRRGFDPAFDVSTITKGPIHHG